MKNTNFSQIRSIYPSSRVRAYKKKPPLFQYITPDCHTRRPSSRTRPSTVLFRIYAARTIPVIMSIDVEAYSRGVSTQSAVKTEEWSGSDSRRTNRANHPSKKPLLTGRVLLSGTICSTRKSEKNDARPHAGCDRWARATYGQKTKTKQNKK